jgi:hypothetical protein
MLCIKKITSTQLSQTKMKKISMLSVINENKNYGMSQHLIPLLF